MNSSLAARALPVILVCSAAFAGGVRAMGSTLSQAAGAGLFIALASTGTIAAFLAIRAVGRATRPLASAGPKKPPLAPPFD